MSGRLWVIGDVHGYSLALSRILQRIAPGPDDTIVTLGDYVDRGPDTAGVIEILLKLEKVCQLIAIRGNHEDMMLELLAQEEKPVEKRKFWNFFSKKTCDTGITFDAWSSFGGRQTLGSYDIFERRIGGIPRAHLDFLKKTRMFYETDAYIFTHAAYVPNLPLSEQPSETLLYYKLNLGIPEPHVSGKRAFVGHSAQRTGKILDAGHLVCLDTFLYGGGWLTAMNPDTGEVLQVDSSGRFREGADASVFDGNT